MTGQCDLRKSMSRQASGQLMNHKRTTTKKKKIYAQPLLHLVYRNGRQTAIVAQEVTTKERNVMKRYEYKTG